MTQARTVTFIQSISQSNSILLGSLVKYLKKTLNTKIKSNQPIRFFMMMITGKMVKDDLSATHFQIGYIITNFYK